MARRLRSEWLKALGVAAVALALVAGIDEAQVECEEAVAHVLDCCPDADPQDICGGGCTEVAISVEQSACLRGLSCNELRDGGICDRFRQMIPDAGTTGGTGLCE